ncbi:Crp/Fnr family transcriptional regulator [Luteibacter sp. UNCMF366Tsu5.1]|uniref:Crp/Fnr family transcriptional regulator n=1 Tax=Luteibacter sp. UNCMF366Tsu5.1 TaxID=1502758 RepID=UPI000908F097|nr:helix-turn-helix domain-containing protein [Luteibacter sp. UNCMF366Tsu5.1]SFW23072.1 CRP/FNR family transcriptional regulator, anaerobic regulatory protein [Luteibacter sp. UNCMF366Tsu5.1]
MFTNACSHPAMTPPTVALPKVDIEALKDILPIVRHKHAAGQHLYRAGQAFRAIHLVHVGSYKICDLADDGREKVTAFKMKGELLGVESIGLGTYACDAVALEDSETWEMPYPAVMKAAATMPGLQEQIHAALAAEIRCDRSWMLLLGTLAAEPRVAALLIDLAARHARLGYSAKHFILRMSRLDMASFLALKHETVSRVLSRLVDMHYIEVKRREVHLLDVEGLRAMACAQAA